MRLSSDYTYELEPDKTVYVYFTNSNVLFRFDVLLHPRVFCFVINTADTCKYMLRTKHVLFAQWTMVRAHFGQSIFSFFEQKRKSDVLLILVIFTYFKVQTKIEEKKLVRKIDHFFIFLILKSASKIQKIL